MNLNPDQQKAFDEIINFIENPTVNEMICLKGYAGTGKTYLISRVIETIKSKHKYWRIAMTAPTNKAVQVLRESSKLNPDEVNFKTIHSLLGLKEVIKDSGEIEFEKDWDEDANSFTKNKVVIIDEVSMLPDKLFYEVKRYNNQTKIILMGDPAQIPPVGKEDCEPFLNPIEHGIRELQLTQIMRQADGSSIIENSMRIRQNLAIDGFAFAAGNDIAVYHPGRDRENLKNYFFGKYNKETKIYNDTIKVIAWTNRKVNEYNGFIRAMLYGTNAPRFVKGERLIMNKPYNCVINIGEDKIDELLTTNMEIIGKSYDPEDFKYGDFIFRVYRTRVKYKNAMGKHHSGIIYILHESSEKAFKFKLNEFKTDAIKAKMSDRTGKWKRFYGLMRSVADVQYAYATTAHRAQGSTYKTAIVDAGNIQLNQNIYERNRILYTSVTRAKDELVIIQ